jgi:hypothetical protein
MPIKIVAEVPQGSVLALILYSLYINNASAAAGTHPALFVDIKCAYTAEKHECRALCKLQRGLTAASSWCERQNIKINEGKPVQFISPEDLESLTTYYNCTAETFPL